MVVSVIICTRDRARYLQQCLESLVDQTLPASQYEVLVVDNASSDTTPKVVEEIVGKVKAPSIRYFIEPNIGLSNARNCGIRMSKWDIIAFIDDDARAFPEWLSETVRSFLDDEVMIAGGRIELEYEKPKPVWVTPEMEIFLTRVDWGSEEKRIVLPQRWLAGANVAFRRSVLEQYSFSNELGRKGTSMLSGEETELCLRVQEDGGVIFYNPKAVVLHSVPLARLTKSFFRRRVLAAGFSDMIINGRIKGSGYVAIQTLILPLRLAKRVCTLVVCIFRMDRRLRCQLSILYAWGEFLGSMKWLMGQKQEGPST